MYQQYIDGDDSYKDLEEDKDPFFDPPEDLMVGSANVFLQSLSYALDFEDKLVITDYKVWVNLNVLQIAIVPICCSTFAPLISIFPANFFL